MALTVKQAEWIKFKQEYPPVRRSSRGVAVTIAERRKDVKCVCVHTPKHHRRGGGCRKGCDCNAGTR